MHNIWKFQVGPMLVTHRGLSGPVILRLSAWGARYLFDSGYKGKGKSSFALCTESSDYVRVEMNSCMKLVLNDNSLRLQFIYKSLCVISHDL